MPIMYTQERDFISAVIGTDLLQNSIEWIAINLNPQDVFSAEELESWAENNGYIKDDNL